MSVTLITATGGRPEAFALLERFISRQTFSGDVQWLVVDDVDPATECTMGQTVIRPQPKWKPGEITLARNLMAALALAKHDKILFIEDDERYGPDYLQAMYDRLNLRPLAGEIPARYYNVATRQYRVIPNTSHASLCQTGIRRELMPAFLKICEAGGKFLDLPLWRGYSGWVSIGENVVSIKGMPGRHGVGVGHRPQGGNWKADPNLAVLRSWIGADASLYEQFAEAVAA